LESKWSPAAEKGWYCSLGLGRGASNCSPHILSIE
jgi:hypothetical protein